MPWTDADGTTYRRPPSINYADANKHTDVYRAHRAAVGPTTYIKDEIKLPVVLETPLDTGGGADS